jgi:hypothetical protein
MTRACGRPGLALAALVSVAIAGCAQSSGAPSTEHFDRVVAHGVAAELPPGWKRAISSLTPHLTDPREVLSVGTFPLRYRPVGCDHMPSSALEDLGPGDALITLEERGLDPTSTWPDFPARPSHFGPELGGRSEASDCVPGARFTDHWFGFTDAGRHFHVLVAFGPEASAEVQRQAWGILDSLRIDPDMPDWQSSG